MTPQADPTTGGTAWQPATVEQAGAAFAPLVLPMILEEGEVISNRPSLGPGNDKSRPFDLETNRRVAEFKVALWSGGDMMRKRGVTADLVRLALDESGRRPELWFAGT